MTFLKQITFILLCVPVIAVTKVADADVGAAGTPCPKLFSALVLIQNTTSKLTKAQYEKHINELRPFLVGLKSPDFGVYLGAREPAFFPPANLVQAPLDMTGFLKKRRVPNAKYELGLFVPIKKAIWKAIARDLDDPARKGLILQKILSAIREQAQIVFRNGLVPIETDNTQLNADLIDRIEKKFRR